MQRKAVTQPSSPPDGEISNGLSENSTSHIYDICKIASTNPPFHLREVNNSVQTGSSSQKKT